jgi:hypothetical protein
MELWFCNFLDLPKCGDVGGGHDEVTAAHVAHVQISRFQNFKVIHNIESFTDTIISL